MKSKIFLSAFISLLLVGCSDENEDKVKQIEKDGSAEIKVGITHLSDSFDLATINKTFWVKGKAFKVAQSVDTIPSLGKEKEEGEDENGNDSTITVNKNYQIFITVK